MPRDKQRVDKVYHVVHSRWIRGGSQNGEFIADGPFGRLKLANGQARHNFRSNMEMLLKHDIYGEDVEVDEDDLSVVMADEEGLWYRSKFFVMEQENNATRRCGCFDRTSYWITLYKDHTRPRYSNERRWGD